MMKISKKGEKGFTLIELMIVVAIIGILAAIAIPRFAQMLEKAREGSTKGNIGSMKSAISIYYGDHEGIWPTTIDLNSSMSTKSFSNFMDSIPPVKATCPWRGLATSPAGTTATEAKTVVEVTATTGPTTATFGWLYNSSTGDVFVNSTLTDSKGLPYSTYGRE